MTGYRLGVDEGRPQLACDLPDGTSRSTKAPHSLDRWFSVTLTLPPFNTAAHVVVTQVKKVFLWLPPNNFAIVMNGNVNTFLRKRFDRGVVIMMTPAWSGARDSWSRGLLVGELSFPSPDHNSLIHDPVFALLCLVNS